MDPEIPVFLVCLVMSAFFSGSETALLSASRLSLRRLAAEGDEAAARVVALVHDPRRLLAGILVGNNIFNVMAAAAATAWCVDRFSRGAGVAVATATSTAFLVLFSEYLPKTIAALKPVVFARAVVVPIRIMLWLLTPAVLPLEALTRPLSVFLRKGRDRLGLAEMRMAVAEGVRAGVLDPTMARILRGGLSMEWKTVADVLIPRVDVVSVDAGATYTECVEVFRREGYSRVLVVEGTSDNDLGYLASKDLALVDRDHGTWTARLGLRAALRVPASLALPQILARMRRSGVHFAVVKDEYGGTEGIVTLEDVLEELVGEIRDEHDIEEAAPLVPAGPHQWLVKGDVIVKDLQDRLELDLVAGDARTVGGLFAQELGRVPHQGDVLERPRCRLVVESVEDNRVLQVRLTVLPAPELGAPPPDAAPPPS